MEFDSVINKRKSVRSFTNKGASWKDVLEAVDAAIQGPFAGNQDNLNFLIVENPSSIKEISSNCEQPWIKESKILIIVCSNDLNLENQYGERGRVYSRQQAGAAIQTLLLKLTDLGLSGCWVGAYSDKSIKQILGIPNNIQIEAIIPVGHSSPTLTKTRKNKRKLESVLFWEEWKKERRPPNFKDVTDKRALRSPTTT